MKKVSPPLCTWSQVARLVAPDAKKDDDFGRVVTLKGGMLAIGAPTRDSTRGAIYGSNRNSRGGWSAPVVVASGSEPWDGVGTSISAPSAARHTRRTNRAAA